MGKVAFKQADVERAVRSVRNLGLPVAEVKIAPDGSISVLTVSGAASQGAPSPLEEWERKRGLGGA